MTYNLLEVFNIRGKYYFNGKIVILVCMVGGFFWMVCRTYFWEREVYTLSLSLPLSKHSIIICTIPEETILYECVQYNSTAMQHVMARKLYIYNTTYTYNQTNQYYMSVHEESYQKAFSQNFAAWKATFLIIANFEVTYNTYILYYICTKVLIHYILYIYRETKHKLFVSATILFSVSM